MRASSTGERVRPRRGLQPQAAQLSTIQHLVPCSLTSVEEELAAAAEAVSGREQRVRELQAEIRGEEQGRSPGER